LCQRQDGTIGFRRGERFEGAPIAERGVWPTTFGKLDSCIPCLQPQRETFNLSSLAETKTRVQIRLARGDMMKGRTNEKLLALHHELLYPAFLGAALFEFARKIVHGLVPLDFPCFSSNLQWFSSNRLWLATALWFILYFSVAFLALAQTAETPEKAKLFGPWAFVANLAEISVILLVSVALALIENSDKPSAPPSTAVHHIELNYPGIYLGWLLIPITGSASNWFSYRDVYVVISGIAIIVGLLGLFKVGIPYFILLIIAYILLALYLWSVFDPVRSKRWLYRTSPVLPVPAA
jgi:hypothetical protein